MEVYKDDPGFSELHDALPTIKFIAVIDDLIHAMMSRIPQNALRPSDTCKHKKVRMFAISMIE